MIPAGEIWLENGNKEQGYWIVDDRGLTLVTFDGFTVLTLSDKEFLELKKEYDQERGGDLINDALKS